MLNKDQILKEANYVLEKNATVREVANVFGRSKSSIHKDLTVRLQKVNFEKWEKVEKLFLNHKELRHIKGGESTKLKFQKIK